LTFELKPGLHCPIPPEVLGEELLRVWNEHGQRLDPVDVVDAARDKNAPLHPCFEWNNATAAEQFRLSQARNWIRRVRVISESGVSEPAFVHVHLSEPDRPVQRFYQRATTVILHPSEFAAAVASFRRQLQSLNESLEELQRMAKGKKADRNLPKIGLIAEALATAREISARLQ
jgi:hypothetical protein